MKAQKSILPKSVHREWLEMDVSGKPLGRVASSIASILRGKHKRNFTPHMDLGDFVVVVNAGKIKLTGKKIEQKQYYHYSGYPGGLRKKRLKDVFKENPGEVLRAAVFNMIDDNKLRKGMMRRLKITNDHNHQFKIDKKI